MNAKLNPINPKLPKLASLINFGTGEEMTNIKYRLWVGIAGTGVINGENKDSILPILRALYTYEAGSAKARKAAELHYQNVMKFKDGSVFSGTFQIADYEKRNDPKTPVILYKHLPITVTGKRLKERLITLVGAKDPAHEKYRTNLKDSSLTDKEREGHWEHERSKNKTGGQKTEVITDFGTA